MISDLKNHIIEEFSSAVTQELYFEKAERGLWKSEEILIEKYFKPKSSVLDIGCGTGRTTIHLHELGYDVLGVDITPAMISNAKMIAGIKKLKIKYEIGDATDLKFNDNSFDNAFFSFNGWTQIPGKMNRQKALQEAFRVIKPGGYYIFTSHFRKIRGFTFFWIYQWFRFFILKPLGFKIAEVDFGDRFFKREGSGKIIWNQKQYIHIPGLKDVKNQIANAGFELVFMARANAISDEKTGEGPLMFFVCKKAG